MNKKLIVGLGNFDKKFDLTRHNAGFMFLDYFKEKVFEEGINWNKADKLDSYISDYKTDLNHFILLKPTTFMNDSGRAVSKAINWYDIDTNKDLFIVHDDLDLRLGTYKLQFNKGPHIHNGVNSIENTLGTDKFWRLRLGIENRENKDIQGKDYVLGRFSDLEMKFVEDMLAAAYASISSSEDFYPLN